MKTKKKIIYIWEQKLSDVMENGRKKTKHAYVNTCSESRSIHMTWESKASICRLITWCLTKMNGKRRKWIRKLTFYNVNRNSCCLVLHDMHDVHDVNLWKKRKTYQNLNHNKIYYTSKQAWYTNYLNKWKIKNKQSWEGLHNNNDSSNKKNKIRKRQKFVFVQFTYFCLLLRAHTVALNRNNQAAQSSFVQF